MRTLINVGLLLLFLFNSLLVIAYAMAGYEKIARPQFKNLRTVEFVWLGLIVVVLIVVNFFIARRFIRHVR